MVGDLPGGSSLQPGCGGGDFRHGRDQTGAVLPGASIFIQNVETGFVRTLIADGAGVYAAPSLPVGQYKITVSKEGFQSQVKTGVEIVVGQSVEVDFALSVGALQQSVTVEVAPPPVSLSLQQTSGLVNQRQVKDLPLNGRSYDELVTLNPAIVNYTSERSGRRGHFQLFRREHVRDFGASPAGQSLSAEWD